MATKPRIRTKASTVYEQLRRELLMGEYDHGYRLTEVELAERFGVSRATVREARIRLEAEGLLVGRGAAGGEYTEDHTRDDALARWELREAIEGLAARLAARNMNGWQIGRLQALADEVTAAITAGDGDQTDRSNLAFCRYLVANCGNPILWRVYQLYCLAPGRRRSPRQQAPAPRSIPPETMPDPLVTLCKAIAAYDPDASERAARQRIRPLTERLRQAAFEESQSRRAPC